MIIPIVPIVEAVTTLANTVGLWVAKQKADKIEGKNKDLGKELSDLQIELQKQTSFIASLTQQVQALAVQVEKQEIANGQLRILTFLSLGLSVVLLIAVLWIEMDR